MSKENIKITRGGIQLSLLSFLSEFSASLFLLTYLSLAYHFPIFNIPFSYYLESTLSIEIKIFYALGFQHEELIHQKHFVDL